MLKRFVQATPHARETLNALLIGSLSRAWGIAGTKLTGTIVVSWKFSCGMVVCLHSRVRRRILKSYMFSVWFEIRRDFDFGAGEKAL